MAITIVDLLRLATAELNGEYLGRELDFVYRDADESYTFRTKKHVAK